MATGSLIDGALHAQIYALSRQPWQDRLIADLRVPLDPDRLQEFANKAPDRWMQRLMMLAKLAGFTERTDVHVSGLAGLAQELLGLSDAELFSRYGPGQEAGAESGVFRSLPTPPPKALPASGDDPTPPPPVVPGPHSG